MSKYFSHKKLKLIRDLVSEERLSYLDYKKTPAFQLFTNQIHNLMNNDGSLATLADIIGENPMAE